MYNPFRNWLLKILKVPPEPHPPAGSPGSLRVFRAGKNYFNFRLFGWGFGQLFALAGIVFWVYVFIVVEAEARKRRETEQPAVLPTDAASFEEFVRRVANGEAKPAATAEAGKEAAPSDVATVESAVDRTTAVEAGATVTEEQPRQAKRKGRVRVEGWDGFKRALVEVAMRLPPWAIPLLWALKIIGILVYLIQIPITYILRRLDYEMRWYIVTDRSLRLRWGVAKVQETTMSFANLQQVELLQNPIQRILGLGDVRVQSAGGGSGSGKGEKDGEDSMHRAHFHAVENAQEIRDLILDRLRRFRQAGLGDPDEAHHAEPHPESEPAVPAVSALDAAREVLAEARALKASLR